MNWHSYALGVITIPALWLAWHAFFVLRCTLRDVVRSMRSQIAVLLKWGRLGRALLLALPVFALGCFICHFIEQTVARAAGYETEVI